MNHDIRISLLKAMNPHPLGVRELAKKIHIRPKKVISMVKEMEEHGLLEKNVEKRTKKGRPRYMIKPTILGEDYLKTYNELELKPLRSRKNDLIRASRDAEYVKRLVVRGLSPFQLFLELNAIARTNNRNVT